MALGSPEDQTVINVSSTVQTITLDVGLSSIEFQNTGHNRVYYGKASTLTVARGGIIYGKGDRKVFENLPSNWKISFICAKNQTSKLRRLNYV